MNWLSRLAGSAAGANLFTSYLAQVWPEMKGPFMRLFVITLLLGAFTALNIRGIKMGTLVSNLFTISKLVPLAIFVLGGCLFLAFHTSPARPVAASPSLDAWLSCTLLAVFPYTGWESALTAAGEAKNPDRDAPIAIMAALGIIAPIYVLVQFVVVRTLANPAASDSPVSASAAVFGGDPLANMISVAVMISSLGFLAGGMISTPRLVFALAEQGDLPRWFASVHPRYRTPHISILTFCGLLWAFAILGTFSWNAKLSVVSRLVTYALTCAALPTLRWKKPGLARFRLPLGPLFAVLGITFCVAMLSRMGHGELVVLEVVLGIALLNWIAVRLPPRTSVSKPNWERGPEVSCAAADCRISK
jgi:amino acid transporter